MPKELDPLLLSELRLAVLSILLSVEEADFVYLKNETNATAGNLSVQIDKLQQAGYIEVRKTFQGKRPQTLCKITPEGLQALEQHVETLKGYLEARRKQ
jgi:DNA-binding MarR family transcriptional regulator